MSSPAVTPKPSVADSLCLAVPADFLDGDWLDSYPSLKARIEAEVAGRDKVALRGSRADFEALRIALIDSFDFLDLPPAYLREALEEDVHICDLNSVLGREEYDLAIDPALRPEREKADRLHRLASWRARTDDAEAAPCDLQGREDDDGFVLSP